MASELAAAALRRSCGGKAGSLRPDAASADAGGHDSDVQVVLSGGPGPQVAAVAQVPELAGLQHPVRLAADQHAPAVPERLIQMVGLERTWSSPCAAISEPVPVRSTMVPDTRR